MIDKRTNENGATEDTKTSKKKRLLFQKISELFDFSLFKNLVFIVLFLASSFMCVPCAISMVYLAPHAKDLNIGPSDIEKKLLTIYSEIDMCSRLVIGFNFRSKVD